MGFQHSERERSYRRFQGDTSPSNFKSSFLAGKVPRKFEHLQRIFWIFSGRKTTERNPGRNTSHHPSDHRLRHFPPPPRGNPLSTSIIVHLIVYRSLVHSTCSSTPIKMQMCHRLGQKATLNTSVIKAKSDCGPSPQRWDKLVVHRKFMEISGT